MDRRIKTVLALGAAVLASLGAAAPAWAGGFTQRVSVGAGGEQANDFSGGFGIGISWTGRYVAFASAATNLVPGDNDTLGFTDAYVRDRLTGRTERVSVGLGGALPNADLAGSHEVFISADGRVVVYQSKATNLVAGVVPGRRGEIFAYDRLTGQTELVNVSSAGVRDDDILHYPDDVSADGRFVLFTSRGSTLVAGDSNGFLDVFVRDRKMGTTERVSVNTSGAEANNLSAGGASISPEGRYVAFSSSATNPETGIAAPTSGIYIRDRWRGRTELVHTGLDLGADPSLSATARFVAFDSYNGVNTDIYVHDRVTDTTRLVSRGLGGQPSNGTNEYPAISASGRFIAFLSLASNLVPGDTNEASDIFLYDGITGAITRVSVGRGGTQGDQDSYLARPKISADGRQVAFASNATNLVADDTNQTSDVFVRTLLGRW